MIMPVAMTVLAQTAGPRRIGRVMSVVGVPMLLGPILGPVIGGLIVDSTTWRLIFYVNGGHVALVGCSITTLATLPFAAIGAGTSFVLLAAVLFVRGMGLGAAMMPAISAAYARLDSAQVPRATSALNTLQRVGGPIGTALLAVVLQSEMRSAVGGGGGSGGLQPVPTAVRGRLADPLASAFGDTFAWAAGLSLLAVIAAALLARSERSGEQAKQHTPRERAHAHAAAAS